jgi:RNA polymerase sigma-70 factor (ECF subfamily)
MLCWWPRTRVKRPGAWRREDFTLRFATINGLPGLIVDAPEGPVQTAAFEIEGDVIRALYVVRNPDKLRHLAGATPARSRMNEHR